MYRTLIFAICALSLAGACTSAPAPGDLLPRGQTLPQDREASTDILPPPMQPPPLKAEFEVVGDYAGKKLSLSVNGREIYAGTRPPEQSGVRWQLRHDIKSYPADLMIEIEGCQAPVMISVPETDEGGLLVFRGCAVDLVA